MEQCRVYVRGVGESDEDRCALLTLMRQCGVEPEASSTCYSKKGGGWFVTCVAGAALDQARHALNGTTWRQRTLKLEMARDDFMVKLQKEWAAHADVAMRASQARDELHEPHLGTVGTHHVVSRDRVTAQRMPDDEWGALMAQRKHIVAFEDVAVEPRLQDLSWGLDPVSADESDVPEMMPERQRRPKRKHQDSVPVSPSASGPNAFVPHQSAQTTAQDVMRDTLGFLGATYHAAEKALAVHPQDLETKPSTLSRRRKRSMRKKVTDPTMAVALDVLGYKSDASDSADSFGSAPPEIVDFDDDSTEEAERLFEQAGDTRRAAGASAAAGGVGQAGLRRGDTEPRTPPTADVMADAPRVAEAVPDVSEERKRQLALIHKMFD
ncbi:hypothetical protein FVE85_6795 [Porphyridium purpureum]|uniref:Uncharacterized protein n=1 Tax=Porphyridium purpureum TaxID=35688 RepID=A0A5J4Z7X9_PORPP|nr:hypothetical protein FVE85_6795 [Porphyridium purpureum]|eukprot:POR1449..scf295_1